MLSSVIIVMQDPQAGIPLWARPPPPTWARRLHSAVFVFQGCLYMWDVSKGEVLRIVPLGESDDSVFVRHVSAVANSVVCDYGNQLRVVQFPAVLETKTE